MPIKAYKTLATSYFSAIIIGIKFNKNGKYMLASHVSFNPIQHEVYQNSGKMILMKPVVRYINFEQSIAPQLTIHQTLLALAEEAQREKILNEIQSEIIQEISLLNYQSMKNLVDEAVSHPIFGYTFSKQLVNLLDHEYAIDSPVLLSDTAETVLMQKKIVYENNIPLAEKLHSFIVSIDDYIFEIKKELSSFTFFKDRKKAKLNGACLLKETAQSLIKLASGDSNYASQLDRLQSYLQDNEESLKGIGVPRFMILIQEFKSLDKIARQKYPPSSFGADTSSENAEVGDQWNNEPT